jgi:hypothetical protein
MFKPMLVIIDQVGWTIAKQKTTARSDVVAGGYVTRHEGAGADIGVVTDRNRTQQFRPTPIFTRFPMQGASRGPIERSIPYGNALPHDNFVADDGVVVNDDAAEMFDYESAADWCIHTDLNAEQNL